MLEVFSDFYDRSFAITLIVVAILFIYFFLLNIIFFTRYFLLLQWYAREKNAMDFFSETSYLSTIMHTVKTPSRDILNMAIMSATRDATKGETFLSLTASTAPFIGLFGTVISILETFAALSAKAQTGSLNVIAAGVSDALIATAVGIFVAIFAYTYHQILRRQSYEVVNLIEIQSERLLAKLANKDD